MTPTIDASVARRAIDAKTKPLGALGRLEDVAVRLAVLQETLTPSLARTRVCVFGADHGIALEGVSAYPRAVTAEMMRNFDRGGAAINVIAAANDVSVEVIDVGVDADLTMHAGIRHEKVRCGSRNCLDEPAMTADELDAALEVGRAAARRAVGDGVSALGLGEMGIGNTTVASAVLSALTGQSAMATVGRGTGVSDDVLITKRAIVDRARRAVPARATRRTCCAPSADSSSPPLPVPRSRRRAMVWRCVADGFISTVAVLCALRMAGDDERLAQALFFAHRSAEGGHGIALAACDAFAGCDARPLLQLDMRLGEGSGAALAMPLLRAAAAVMRDMATFEAAGVSAGEHAADHLAPVSV